MTLPYNKRERLVQIVTSMLELGDPVGNTNDCPSVVDMSLNEISNHQQRIEKVSHV
jgi:hypothetical protein